MTNERLSQQAINSHIAILANPNESDARKDISGNVLYEEIYSLRAALLRSGDEAHRRAVAAKAALGEAREALRDCLGILKISLGRQTGAFPNAVWSSEVPRFERIAAPAADLRPQTNGKGPE